MMYACTLDMRTRFTSSLIFRTVVGVGDSLMDRLVAVKGVWISYLVIGVFLEYGNSSGKIL